MFPTFACWLYRAAVLCLLTLILLEARFGAQTRPAVQPVLVPLMGTDPDRMQVAVEQLKLQTEQLHTTVRELRGDIWSRIKKESSGVQEGSK